MQAMKNIITTAALLAVATPAAAQDEAGSAPAPSPNQIVGEAPAREWGVIPPEDLLVMTLAPDAAGNERKVVIQLMPAPFSQGWVENIRTLARAGWYDGISVNRVQDNYVVQWGDPGYDNPESGETEQKPLPEGLRVMGEEAYSATGNALSEADSSATTPTSDTASTGDAEITTEVIKAQAVFSDRKASEADREKAMDVIIRAYGLDGGYTSDEPLDVKSTKSTRFPEGWHQRDGYALWVEFWRGWPLANFERTKPETEATEAEIAEYGLVHRGDGTSDVVFESFFWPIHCYGMVGVGRGYSPDTGSGAELYTVIGHAPRHLDRNIALVGRIIEGMEHLSSLPRGSGTLGFYTDEEAEKRTPILSVRVVSDLPESEQVRFEYLSTEGETFAKYAEARANRRDPFFIHPAGGADICNIPVPVRRVTDDEK